MNMRASKNKTTLLATFTVLAILGLLYSFVYTLKRNVEPPPESVAIVGPAEYFNPDANPIHANIGVYVINVGNLDLTTGIYFMDFYLGIYCDRPCQPDVDILNAASALKSKNKPQTPRAIRFTHTGSAQMCSPMFTAKITPSVSKR